MEISGSAFVSGFNAVQSGSARVAQASSEIARNTVEARSPQAEQMVELTHGKLKTQSGARIIEVADETLGTLIDTHAWLPGDRQRPSPTLSFPTVTRWPLKPAGRFAMGFTERDESALDGRCSQ